MILNIMIKENDYEKIQQINLSEVKEISDYTNLQGELACAGGTCEIF